jgi:hypothetical protein
VAVSVLTAAKWFKPDLDRVIALAGMIGLTVETLQTDAVGMAVAGGLTALAINQIWREKRSPPTGIRLPMKQPEKWPLDAVTRKREAR